MNLAENKVTVFSPQRDEGRKNTVRANISSISGKDRDGNLIFSSWNARFVGRAFEPALALEDKQKILLKESRIDSDYNKEKKQSYVTVTVFDFEVVE